MTGAQAVEYLLTHACPSIQYRVRREILHEAEDGAEMQALQEQITALPKVKKAFACQREDGFFGSVLHGVYFDGFDATVELLKRLGVALTDPHMVRAREGLVQWQDYERDHFYRVGNAMDEHGRGGFRAIVADVLAELGADETVPQVARQVELSLGAFRGALSHGSVDDFSKKATFRGEPCRYYLKGALFPAANHVSILRKTRGWRSAENVEMVRRSYAHCRELMRECHDMIYVNCGYFVGPFNVNWHAVPHRVDLCEFDAHPIDFAWFMKGLSTASVHYPLFEEDTAPMAETLTGWLSDDGFSQRLTDEHLRLFKKYAAIEPTWRRRESVLCDLMFPMVRELARLGEI